MAQFCLGVTPHNLVFLRFLEEQLMLLWCTLIAKGNLAIVLGSSEHQ